MTIKPRVEPLELNYRSPKTEIKQWKGHGKDKEGK